MTICILSTRHSPPISDKSNYPIHFSLFSLMWFFFILQHSTPSSTHLFSSMPVTFIIETASCKNSQQVQWMVWVCCWKFCAAFNSVRIQLPGVARWIHKTWRCEIINHTNEEPYSTNLLACKYMCVCSNSISSYCEKQRRFNWMKNESIS